MRQTIEGSSLPYAYKLYQWVNQHYGMVIGGVDSRWHIATGVFMEYWDGVLMLEEFLDTDDKEFYAKDFD